MENFGILYVHFKAKTLISSIRIRTRELINPNKAKEALKSKLIDIESNLTFVRVHMVENCNFIFKF